MGRLWNSSHTRPDDGSNVMTTPHLPAAARLAWGICGGMNLSPLRNGLIGNAIFMRGTNGAWALRCQLNERGISGEITGSNSFRARTTSSLLLAAILCMRTVI